MDSLKLSIVGLLYCCINKRLLSDKNQLPRIVKFWHQPNITNRKAAARKKLLLSLRLELSTFQFLYCQASQSISMKNKGTTQEFTTLKLSYLIYLVPNLTGFKHYYRNHNNISEQTHCSEKALAV